MDSAIDAFFAGQRIFPDNTPDGWESGGDMTTSQAEALRAFLTGRRDAATTAAHLYRLAAEERTHEDLESFTNCAMDAIHAAAIHLIDLQPRLVELVAALRLLPPVPSPEGDVSWTGDVGVNALKSDITETICAQGAYDEFSRASYALLARFHTAGDSLGLEMLCLGDLPRMINTPMPPDRLSMGVSAIAQMFIHGMAPYALDACRRRQPLNQYGAEMSMELWEKSLQRFEELAEDASMTELARADARAAAGEMRKATRDTR